MRTKVYIGVVASASFASLAAPLHGAETANPQALGLGETYRLVVDAHTGDEDTTEPKTDANDGLNGDNPYYQRTNVARAHLDYWYTSSYQNPGEPDPGGPQWIDYRPPLDTLGHGSYRIVTQYRQTDNRADYNTEYIVHHEGGTTTILRNQLRQGTGYVTFVIGEFDLGSTGYVRVNDPGAGSISFGYMEFTYIQAGSCDVGQPIVLDLGTEDDGNCLVRVDNPDGDTVPVDIAGRNARRNSDPAGSPADSYLYFAVSDSYAFQASRSDLYITIDYYDTGSGGLELQYDSDTGSDLAAIYRSGGSVTLTGTDTWRQHTYHVTDAYFANRQNSGADFRIARMAGGYFYLDAVQVTDRRPGLPADYDRDGDVDLDDFGQFQRCYSGQGQPYEPGCTDADLNHDGDVDTNDFGMFAGCLSGANMTAEAGCLY